MVNIYGTLGPAYASEKVLAEMFSLGMTGMRLNLSHVTLAESGDLIGKMKRAAEKCGVKPQLLVDLQGPELRTGTISEPVSLKNGDIVEICGITEKVKDSSVSGADRKEIAQKSENKDIEKIPAEKNTFGKGSGNADRSQNKRDHVKAPGVCEDHAAGTHLPIPDSGSGSSSGRWEDPFKNCGKSGKCDREWWRKHSGKALFRKGPLGRSPKEQKERGSSGREDLSADIDKF